MSAQGGTVPVRPHPSTFWSRRAQEVFKADSQSYRFTFCCLLLYTYLYRGTDNVGSPCRSQ
jgi:hypothetical protein